jgi:hypothetical protein
MSQTRRHFTAEQKAAIVRRRLGHLPTRGHPHLSPRPGAGSCRRRQTRPPTAPPRPLERAQARHHLLHQSWSDRTVTQRQAKNPAKFSAGRRNLLHGQVFNSVAASMPPIRSVTIWQTEDGVFQVAESTLCLPPRLGTAHGGSDKGCSNSSNCSNLSQRPGVISCCYEDS